MMTAEIYDIAAVLKVYPHAVTVDSIEGAWDEDGNRIELDLDALAAVADEVAEEGKWKGLRARRNILLAKTDWWAFSDRTMTAEQTAYRQALRDLPANTTDPANPVWPTKP